MHQETRKQKETTGRQSTQACLQHQYWGGGAAGLHCQHRTRPLQDCLRLTEPRRNQQRLLTGVPPPRRAHSGYMKDRPHTPARWAPCANQCMSLPSPEQAHTTRCRRHHTTRNTGTARLHASTRHERREGCCQQAGTTCEVPQPAEGWLQTDCACSRRQQRVGCCMRHTVCCWPAQAPARLSPEACAWAAAI